MPYNNNQNKCWNDALQANNTTLTLAWFDQINESASYFFVPPVVFCLKDGEEMVLHARNGHVNMKGSKY